MYIVQSKQPKKELRRWDEILFDEFFNDSLPKHPVGTMKTDIKESEDKYSLEIEMPGYDKSDVNISLEEGYLTVSATKKYENDDTNNKYIRKERFFGTTSRSYYVGDVDKEKIEASYKDGVLLIDLPKEEKKVEEKKFIQIK